MTPEQFDVNGKQYNPKNQPYMSLNTSHEIMEYIILIDVTLQYEGNCSE